jgi:hypothetical protein
LVTRPAATVRGLSKNASPWGCNFGRPTASLRHSPTAILILIDALFSSCLSRGRAHCRATGREVVADVHVHPGAYHQSGSDQDNPVMAEIGHIAIILPNYAQRAAYPGGIGLFEYLGGRRWQDRSRQKPSPLHIGWWPSWL